MLVATFLRSPGDDFPYSVSFAAVDVFASDHVVTATVTNVGYTPASPAPASTTLTLGSASILSDVVTFNVSGGTRGYRYTVRVAATNSAGRDCERDVVFAVE